MRSREICQPAGREGVRLSRRHEEEPCLATLQRHTACLSHSILFPSSEPPALGSLGSRTKMSGAPGLVCFLGDDEYTIGCAMFRSSYRSFRHPFSTRLEVVLRPKYCQRLWGSERGRGGVLPTVASNAVMLAVRLAECLRRRCIFLFIATVLPLGLAVRAAWVHPC